MLHIQENYPQKRINRFFEKQLAVVIKIPHFLRQLNLLLDKTKHTGKYHVYVNVTSHSWIPAKRFEPTYFDK